MMPVLIPGLKQPGNDIDVYLKPLIDDLLLLWKDEGVHLVKEIGILSPIFLHNMFSFERYFAVLKKYVRNRARPEGSIAKGYVTEEVIEFLLTMWKNSAQLGFQYHVMRGD